MTLDKGTCREEELLRTALVNEFHDMEEETHAEAEMLATMNSLRPGDGDVFHYSRRVIRFLQHTPSGLDRFKWMFISNYLNGLSSAPLPRRELAISTFRQCNSSEPPMKIVKGVMHLATQLKVRGYHKQESRRYDDDDEEEDNNDDDNSNEVAISDEDDDDYDDDYYSDSQKTRRKGK